MSAEFPFRFYGAAPADWYEGALCGHYWEIKFKDELEETALSVLSDSFSKWLPIYSSIESGCGPAKVCGQWLFVCFGEEEGEEDEWGDADSFWEDIESVFNHIHRDVPIEEIHFLGAREPGYDSWSEWSVAQKRLPGPAPRWEEGMMDIGVFGAGMERFDAEIREVNIPGL